MAEQDIIQNMISRLGQSQNERLPKELERYFARVDERTREDLLAQARKLAEKLNFYLVDKEKPLESVDSVKVEGDWKKFFQEEEITRLDSADGSVPPHLGLFAAFLELYGYPQAAINTITGRHLDFQFQRVLRFVPRPAQPDRAHLLLELKKGIAPILVGSEQSFTAGKDTQGIELIYRPVRDVEINHGSVAAVKSVFRDGNRLRFAPIANSADGLGGALDKDQPRWRPFGGSDLPPAPIGFAVASPVIRMLEGDRKIHVELQLASLGPGPVDALAGAFEAYATGPKGWLGPYALTGSLADGRLTLSAEVKPTEPAIIDYSPAIHGHSFSTQSPVLQFLLKPESTLNYGDLAGLAVGEASIRVEVEGLTELTLENDYGSLNPKKAFLPFGPQPVIGSQFMIGCPEALSKRLQDLRLTIRWQGAPPDLGTWYADYVNRSQMSNGVTATMTYRDRFDQTQVSIDIMARVNGLTTLSPAMPPPTGRSALRGDFELYEFMSAESALSRRFGRELMLRRPISGRPDVPNPQVRSGFVTIALSEDFLHADYRKETVYNAVQRNGIVLNEPYTPTIQSISLAYKAQSDRIDVGADDVASFINSDLQFFHVGCFGQMREHGFLRGGVSYVQDKRVHLLPEYPAEGELHIGVAGVAAGDGLSLLMQVAEGSADPSLPPQPLEWAVLGDNYWRSLTPQELSLDTSSALRRSGLIAVALPSETTAEHTIMPTGMVWLRATIRSNSGAVCRLVRVENNAVEVRLGDLEMHPEQLASVLPAGSIGKAKEPIAEVKTVTQPFHSFGGRRRESGEMLTQRAAERLRHRNRCVTPWDYERMLLEAFPEAHKVKCIPHSSESGWLTPGNIMLVVVPDTRNKNAVDPLQPRLDIDTLSRMAEFVRKHCGMNVQFQVKNARYQLVKLDFKVRFMPGTPFEFYRGRLDEALVRALSTWAYDEGVEIEFGGQVYRSVLLDFVEKLPYVDFVTDFKLLSPDSVEPRRDRTSVRAETPDAILVSARSHEIDEF